MDSDSWSDEFFDPGREERGERYERYEDSFNGGMGLTAGLSTGLGMGLDVSFFCCRIRRHTWLAMSCILHRYACNLDVPEDVPSCIKHGVGGDVSNRTCTDCGCSEGSSFRLLCSDPLVTTVMTELCRLVNKNFAVLVMGSSFIHI